MYKYICMCTYVCACACLGFGHLPQDDFDYELKNIVVDSMDFSKATTSLKSDMTLSVYVPSLPHPVLLPLSIPSLLSFSSPPPSLAPAFMSVSC